MSASPTLVSITDCVQFFAEKGVVVDRTTISRCVKKHGLSEGTRGRQTLVDPAEVLKFYTSDYQRKVMSGEASGAKQRTEAVPAQSSRPAYAEDEPTAPLPGPGTPQRSAAEEEKREKVRALRRDNAIAEGDLVPTVEVAAALASGVGEQRTIWSRMLQEFVETQAAKLKLDTAQALALKTAVREFLAAGQNAFADELTPLIGRGEDDQSPALSDFRALCDLAEQQAADRALTKRPDAA